MNFPHLNYSNEFSHNFQICFIFFVSCDFHSSISIIYVHLLSNVIIAFSHFYKVLQFNPITMVIKLMRPTKTIKQSPCIFPHAIPLSTKTSLIKKNIHQINTSHVTQTASAFCHNKNQLQTLF